MITEITRRDIMELLEEGIETGIFFYYGTFDEVDFFSRLYDLHQLPSTDSRLQFNTAYKDIYQHRINNEDWEWDWFYQYYNDNFDLVSNDEKFLLFLSEIFHPTVVDKNQIWQFYLNSINELLKHDGFRLVTSSFISGRAIYSYEAIENNSVIEKYSDDIKQKFNSDYIDKQIEMMIDNIEKHPNLSIGKAKELLESCAKTILDEMDIMYDKNIELTPLMKKVYSALELDVRSIDNNRKDAEVAIRILGNLTAITQNMAELRNAFGDGHGKNSTFRNLPSRYAELAVGTSTSVVHFIWKTYEDKTRK